VSNVGLRLLSLAVGCALFTVGLAAIYWPLSLVFAGLVLSASALLIDFDRFDKEA